MRLQRVGNTTSPYKFLLLYGSIPEFPLQSPPCPPEAPSGIPEGDALGNRKTASRRTDDFGQHPGSGRARSGRALATRRRDLRSAVKCVANLLGDEPAALPLDIPALAARLNTINPLAAGMTTKRLANIRSDFLAATRFCGVQPVTASKSLSPEWAKLFKRLSGRRAHIGLSRLARYASARGIKPGDVNDDVIVAFIAAVRKDRCTGSRTGCTGK